MWIELLTDLWHALLIVTVTVTGMVAIARIIDDTWGRRH